MVKLNRKITLTKKKQKNETQIEKKKTHHKLRLRDKIEND
jgi:hypothetical protein